MVPDEYTTFLAALAGVAGALIGLLFVAISVAPDRATGAAAPVVEQVRAGSALTAFVAPLIVALFGLLPGNRVGGSATVVGALGVLYAAASARRLLSRRGRRRESLRGLTVLGGFTVVMIADVVDGALLWAQPSDAHAVDSLCLLAVVSLLIGIDRAWQLIGAHERSVSTQIGDLIRGERHSKSGTEEQADPAPGD